LNFQRIEKLKDLKISKRLALKTTPAGWDIGSCHDLPNNPSPAQDFDLEKGVGEGGWKQLFIRIENRMIWIRNCKCQIAEQSSAFFVSKSPIALVKHA